MNSENVFRLYGQPQFYAWGGHDFIRDIVGLPKDDKKPLAEWWLGAHLGAPAVVDTDYGPQALNCTIHRDPKEWLGEDISRRFSGRLPFLMKILDVAQALSIQVHPTRKQAKDGFSQENKQGISLEDPKRNYKDDNHKPEAAIALSEFWLLHGFRQIADMRAQIARFASLEKLLPFLDEGGIKTLYAHVMTIPQAEIDKLLGPVVESLRKDEAKLKKDDPAFWLNRFAKNTTRNFDRGLFSILILNLVKLDKGQAIYQGAGLLHAYLEGQNIELMANSDNVLRAGLTPKHTDVPELMKICDFNAITPNILTPKALGDGLESYELSQPDFAVDVVNPGPDQTPVLEPQGPEILMVYAGEAKLSTATQDIQALAGQSFFIKPGSDIKVSSPKGAKIFRARTGKQPRGRSKA